MLHHCQPNLVGGRYLQTWQTRIRRVVFESHPPVNNKLIQVYIIRQSYLTPIHFYAMGRIFTSNCLQCSQLGAEFNHVMWICLVIANYWKQVKDLLCNLLSTSIPFTLELCLLGLLDKELWPRYIRIFWKKPYSWHRSRLNLWAGAGCYDGSNTHSVQ